MNAEQDMDALLGANVSAASQAVTSGNRFTCYAEFTVNGAEDTDTRAGDYLRNEQSTTGTWGFSANLLSPVALSSGDDVGVSCTNSLGLKVVAERSTFNQAGLVSGASTSIP